MSHIQLQGRGRSGGGAARARLSFQREFWALTTALKSRGLLDDSALS